MMTGKRQRGVSAIGGLLIMIVVCFVALLAIRIVPIYISYFMVKSSLEALAHDSASKDKEMSAPELHSALQKRFEIGYVNIVNAQQVKIRQQGKERILSLTYEDRRTLIGNLDIVANFDINVVLSP